jgi:small-conductance mechanosensitive channel
MQTTTHSDTNRWFLSWLCIAAFLLLAFATTATAQLPTTISEPAAPDAPTLEQPLSKEAVRDMVSRLSDDDVRSLLIQRLDAVAEETEKANQEKAIDVLAQGFGQYWQNLRRALGSLDTIGTTISKIDAAIQPVLGSLSYGHLLLHCLLAIAAGIVAERIVTFFFRKSKQRLIDSYSTSLWGILKILYTRLSMDILGVVAFAAASSVVIANFHEPGSYTHGLATAVKMTVFGGWMAYVICRFFFAPSRPELRICKTTDARAWRMTISFSLLAAYIVGLHNVFYVFLNIGMDNYGGIEYMATLGMFLNLSMYIAAIGVIWYNRTGLSEVLLENKRRVSLAIGVDTPLDFSWFATHWPKIACVLIVAKYFLVEVVMASTNVGVYSTAAVYITFVVIFLWPGIDANVSLFVARGIVTPEDETEAASKARRNMQQGLLRVGRVLVVGAVLFALARLWGVDVLSLAQSGLGAKAAATLIELLFVLLLAYMLWELISVLIGRWLAAEGGAPDDQAIDAMGGEGGGASMSRVATLLPIANKTGKFLIVLMSIIMTLDIMGFNIGPILAGAGVVGLAVGFGAQTLVKDIVSGLFFLADDAFRVGETIDVGGTQGAVEQISLRSLRLRHHEGLVHTIPYGEIPQVTNYSRDWAILKLRFRVPHDTDVNKVKKIFKKIGAEMLEDPVIGPDFLQPFKSQGVAEVDENGMVVRGKFMAKPGKQYTIRKEVFVRVQKAFDEAGIPFARKQVMVHIPGLDKDSPLEEDDVKSIAAAAADAVDEAAPPPPRPGLQGQ